MTPLTAVPADRAWIGMGLTMDILAAIGDLPGAEFGATAADVMAFFWLFACWMGYNMWTDRRAKSSQSLVGIMHRFRLRWMERMMERENRMPDINIIRAHPRSDALFASTSIFILAGVVAILGALDPARDLLSELSFVVTASRAMWEMKLLLLLMIFIYAFFKFAWFIHPWMFMAATVWVIGVLYRRELRSLTHRTLKREMD